MEEIDLKEIFNIFWSKKIWILASVIVFMVIGAIYSYFFVTPQYKAYTTLVLTGSNDTAITSVERITQTDISLNNSLVATYSELVKSKNVLRQVINNLGIEDTEDALKGCISVSVVKSSQLIQIEVVNVDPYKAKIVANELGKVFSSKVSELYNMNNIHVVDEAEEPVRPYNISHVKDLLMFGGVGAVLACGIVFVLSLIDTTIKSKDDIERKLGVSVLVELPQCDFEVDEVKKNYIKIRGI
jgi:capsular polysaccharide biosynthesis protein